MGYFDPVDLALGTLDRLCLVDKLRLNLFDDPERAQKSLLESINEIQKSVKALRDVMLMVSNVSLAEYESNVVANYLDYLASGMPQLAICKTKLSCNRLTTIHQTYLARELNRLVTKIGWKKIDDMEMQVEHIYDLEQVFAELSQLDRTLVNIGQTMMERLKVAVSDIHGAIENDDLKKANLIVKDVHNESLDKVEHLNNRLCKLIKIEKNLSRAKIAA